MNTAYRYFRPSIAKPHNQDSLKITASNMGGITAYVEFSEDMQTMKVAFAVCRIDENFDKSIGRSQAKSNMDAGDFVVMPANNPQVKRRLVDHIFSYLKNNYYTITTKEQRANTIGTVRKMIDVYVENVDCSRVVMHDSTIKTLLTTMLDPNYIAMDAIEDDKSDCNCESCECTA